MRILSFDPGHQTGVAYMLGPEWQWGMTIDHPALTKDLLSHLAHICEPELVVVEAPPTRQVDDISVRGYGLICSWFEGAGITVERVNPGQWKGMVKVDLVISGQHQKEAMYMARWAWKRESAKLWRILGEDNGPR